MRRSDSFFIMVIFFISGFLLSGCADMQLRYEKPSIGKTDKGNICLIFKDQRSLEDFGNDPTVVGRGRNALGMPLANITTSEDRNPGKVFKNLISDCLNASGYNVVNNDGRTPCLDATLKIFWTDEYGCQRMFLEALLTLNPDKPVWKYPLKYDECPQVLFHSGVDVEFTKMLEFSKQDLITQFSSPKFQKEYDLYLRSL